MRVLQLFQCVIGKHHRDRRKVVQSDAVTRSVCEGCGRAMIRDYGEWRLARPKDARLGDVPDAGS